MRKELDEQKELQEFRELSVMALILTSLLAFVWVAIYMVGKLYYSPLNM